MGLGDWIMATAQVARVHAVTGRPVLVVDVWGRPQWSEIFEGNPKIRRTGAGSGERLLNSPGWRPYIARKTPDRYHWQPWNIAPGEIFLSDDERAFGAAHGGRILIEPHTKARAGNKAWAWGRWQALVDRGGDFVQAGPPGTVRLRGVEFVETATFRQAASVLSASRAFVGCEGGLHHAAAALGVPAVVLFSEFIDPAITGYPMHRNLRHAGEACGSRRPCAGCVASMQAIGVDEVAQNLRSVLEDGTRRAWRRERRMHLVEPSFHI
jgi:hypothetical protein